MLDPDGFIRLNRRLQNADLEYSTKFPFLLPKIDHFTNLIIRESHRQVLHNVQHQTVEHIRRSYWIPCALHTVDKVLKQCVTCKKVNARHYPTPPAPPLPADRVSKQPCFNTVGIDYTGEVLVKTETGQKTVYICLFTCAVSRAVHLDYVTDLSAEQFKLCLRRFCARKATPSKIITDNASYFTSSSNDLKELFSDPIITEYISQNNIRWEFIPKRAPNFGAFWERLIGTIKRCIRKVLGKANVTEYELSTLLTEVEAVTNDRPLTVVSGSDDSPVALTPSQLMFGRPIRPLPHPEDRSADPDFRLKPQDAREHSERLTSVIESYWNMWSKEYLSCLRNELNLDNPQNPFKNRVKIGDVVLVHHDQKKRPLWKLAVITKLHTGPDEIVRSMDIKTQHGTTNRPITKLYPLELDFDMDQPETEIQEKENGQNDETIPRLRRNTAMKAKEKIKQQLGYYDEDDFESD